MPTPEVKSGRYKNEIDISNLKRFSNQRAHYASELSSSKSSLTFFFHLDKTFFHFLLSNIWPLKVHLKTLRVHLNIQESTQALGR